MAMTTRCEPSNARNDAGFVDAWIALSSSGPSAGGARALVEGEGEL
jgi:hypothetical protein